MSVVCAWSQSPSALEPSSVQGDVQRVSRFALRPMPDPQYLLNDDAPFHSLPVPCDEGGKVRKVGVEVEFIGLSARVAAQALRDAFGGLLLEEDPHAYLVRTDRLGELIVELDIRYAHALREDRTLPVRLGPRLAPLLGSALSAVVPRELISGPLTIDRLPEIDAAVAVLRAAGAAGRGVTRFGSLGLHFNVDPPQLDAPALVTLLKAYLLLEPWLRQETTVGRPRWWSFLPAPFPPGYVRRVVAPDYQPDLSDFTDHYLAANPTRNRGLDLLPILLHLDEARVRSVLPFEKIGNRPVLHYRLPQAYVGDPAWSIAGDWNRWVAIERLATAPERLRALGRAWQEPAESIADGGLPTAPWWRAWRWR